MKWITQIYALVFIPTINNTANISLFWSVQSYCYKSTLQEIYQIKTDFNYHQTCNFSPISNTTKNVKSFFVTDHKLHFSISITLSLEYCLIHILCLIPIILLLTHLSQYDQHFLSLLSSSTADVNFTYFTNHSTKGR